MSVVGESGCTWPVSDDQDWITTPSSVSTGGSVTIEVGRNYGDDARSGTVAIGGRPVTVSQAAPPLCTPHVTVAPPSVSFGSGAGSDRVGVLVGYSAEDLPCRRADFPVSTPDDWIGVSPSSVSGGPVWAGPIFWAPTPPTIPIETVTIGVSANPGSARSGTVAVGHRVVNVFQCGRRPAGVSPASLSFAAAGGTADVTVTGDSRCSSPVSDDQTWIMTPSSVSGGGSVRVTVEAHTGTTTRSGTVTIGTSPSTLTVTVTQPPPPCPASPDSVTPDSLSFAAEGEAKQVTVNGRRDCSWGVRDDRAWIVDTPPTVTGGDVMTVTVLSGHAGESGTVTVGEEDIPITVRCPSSPTSVSPDDLSFHAGGGSQDVAVDGPTGCSWSVLADQDWITVNPSMVSGGRSVTVRASNYTVTEEIEDMEDTDRSGTVTIGGLLVDVRQSAENAPLVIPPLSPLRNTLITNWAARNGETDVCEAWHSLHYSARNVFIWNTHRLNQSNLLADVTELHAVFGTDSFESCGGEEYNRTYMSMTRSLQDRFLAEARRSDTASIAQWRHTQDPEQSGGFA